MWQHMPGPNSKSSQFVLYLSSDSIECCVPGTKELRAVFSFTLYNPCIPQTPSHAVSISAMGVPIIASAMRESLGTKDPMYVMQPKMTMSKITQSNSHPCTANVVTVSLRTDSILYARCNPKIILTELMGLTASVVNLTAVTSVTSVNATKNSTLLQWRVQGQTSDPWQVDWLTGNLTKSPREMMRINTVCRLDSTRTNCHAGEGYKVGLKTKLSGNTWTDSSYFDYTGPMPVDWHITLTEAGFVIAAEGLVLVTFQQPPGPKMLFSGIKIATANAGDVNVISCIECETSRTVVTQQLAIAHVGGGPSTLAAIAIWKNQSLLGGDASSLQIAITSAEVAANTVISFTISIQNPNDPTSPDRPPTAEIAGIGMDNITMERSTDYTLWPVTVIDVVFSKSEIVQSTPYPASGNRLTITLAVSSTIAASCKMKIIVSGLEGACFSSATKSGVVDMQGVAAPRFDHSQATAIAPSNVSGVVHSRASWDAVYEELSFYVAGEGLMAEQDYTFSFEIRNPSSAQSSPSVSIEAIGIPIIATSMQKNPNKITPPSIFGSTPSEAEPMEIRGLSVSSSFLIKKIGQSNANPGETNSITLTLSLNLPLTSAAPLSSISLSGLRGAQAPSGPMLLTVSTQATSGSFSGEWHDGEKRLKLTVLSFTVPGASYVISFQVTNAKEPQTSPGILIETSGIVIQPVTMEPDTVGTLTMKDDLGKVIQTGEGAKAPLYILAPRLIKRYVDQVGGSAWPTQSNIISFSFAPTVSLSPAPGGRASIIISGLHGVDLSSGPVSITGDSADKFTDCPVLNASTCTTRRGTWNADTNKLSMNVYSTLTAFEDLSIKFNFTNSIVGQDPPVLSIELTTEADANINGLTLTEYNWTKQGEGDFTVSTSILDRYFVDDMVQVAQKVVQGFVDKDLLKDGNVLTKNYGLGLKYDGILFVESPGEYTFGVVGDDSTDVAVDGTVVASREGRSWDINSANGPHISHTITLGKGSHSFRARCLQQADGVGVIAYWKTPSDPTTFVEIPRSAFRLQVEAIQLPPADFGIPLNMVGTDNIALLIYRSASFVSKSVSQSSTASGATNTITLSFKPQFPLTGSKNSTLTLSGLVGSVTPDSTIKLLDAGALFNSTAKWAAKTGTLVLAVAPGQTVPSTSITVVKFDLDNPTIPQTGPSMIQLSAKGDVPFSAVAVTLGAGDAAPLKVIASTFSIANIGQSSSAPAADNTITVTLQPGIILSKSRDSIITVHGIKGSDTASTDALPIAMSGGDAVVFSSPISDIGVSFSPNCKLEDDKIELSDNSETDFTGTILHFNTPESGPLNCSSRWTKVKSYNISTHCATLTVTSGSWSDGQAKCSDLGFVQEVRVLGGGTGYQAGAAVVGDGATGSGLSGTCNVDTDSGRILSVSLSNKGTGYSPTTRLSCPAACTSSTCGISENGAMGGEVELSVVQRSVVVSAGQWDQLTGTIVLRVHAELSITTPTVFSFKVRNSLTPQGKSDVWLMAGGQTPIGSKSMNGTVMLIEGANTSLTATCACAPAAGATSCSCASNVTGLPTGRAVYALKAEVQCNSATNVVVTVDDVAQSSDVVKQPPKVCKDACQRYHTLFEWLNVASSVDAQGTLPLKVAADTIGTDYCGGGDNLKVLFTLYY